MLTFLLYAILTFQIYENITEQQIPTLQREPEMATQSESREVYRNPEVASDGGIILPIEGGAVDLDILSQSFAKWETGGCTTGVGKRLNNCHGIRCVEGYPCDCEGSNGCWAVFPSKEESRRYWIENFWCRLYSCGLPTLDDIGDYNPSNPEQEEKYKDKITATYFQKLNQKHSL